MALNKIYTDNTVVKRNNSSGGIAWVATKPYKELFGEGEFDLSILLNNSSTSKILNNGAYGDHPTKYNSANVVASGEPTTPIQFLGCFLSTNDSYSLIYGINVTQKMSMNMDVYGGDSWQQFIDNFRFIVDFVPADGISYQEYQDFDYYNTTKVKYGLSSSYLTFSALYNTSNAQLYNRKQTLNPESITGDDAKRFLRSSISVTTTNYNKYMSDTTSLSKENLTTLWYAFRVNGDLIIIREPDYLAPASDYNKVYFKIDSNTRKYLTIGGFSDSVEDGTTGGLPTDDDSKGLYVAKFAVSGQYKLCDFYYLTNNAIMHNANSSGIKWTVNEISTAKNFRDYVRLGVMDENGLITHNEWIQGETAIADSNNPNKNGSYSDLPEWKPGGGGDDDDESDDINFGGSYAGLGAFAKFYLCSGLAVSDLNSWINGRSPDLPENFDPMTQIISISRFATDLSSASYGSTTIKFHTTAGAEIDTKIPALHGNGDNIELDLGSVNIPLRMKERGIPFLDYESTIELYIPACGTFILDPQTVLGSTLSVKMWLSTSTGECNSIAYVTRNGVKAPVAYGSGSLAVPMPVTSIGWGSYLAAVTNANIKYYFGALGTLSSEAQLFGGEFGGNQYAAASGLAGLVSPFQNMAQTEQNLAHLKNSSFTSVSGSFGSTAAWNYPFNAYVKITRRHFKKPSNYAHTRGIPLVETKTLRDCSGFTICVNADVSSINATIQEKNMIVEALNNGVIV